MLKIISFLILNLAPIFVLIRDWKFYDKRTIKNRNITIVIICLWFFTSLVVTYFALYDSSQINELIDGKNQLLKEIRKYQEGLEQKNIRIKELESVQRYSSVAKLGMTGWASITPFSEAYPKVDTPIALMLNGTYTHEKEDEWIFNCDSESEVKYRKIIEGYPDFPFTYYYLAYCLHSRNDAIWKTYAEKAVEIFKQTTAISGHHQTHDQIMKETLKLLNE